jgi:hypothetical protein
MIAAARDGWLRLRRAWACLWPLPPRVALAATTVILLCSVVLLYHIDPASGRLPRCGFHALTALHCPGCGSTRALHALLHGDLAMAIRFNVFALPAVALLGVAYARWTWRTLTGPPPPPGDHFGATARPAWLFVLAAILFFFWIARNIPIYPLTLLAPPSSGS